MKTSIKLIFAFAAVALFFGVLTSCDPQHANCQRELDRVLNSEEGQTMTADQIMVRFSKIRITKWDEMRGVGAVIDIKATNVNTPPQEGVSYISPKTGSVMVFTMGDFDENFHAAGKVDIVSREDHWGNPMENRADSVTYFVQSRGKSIYTIYSYKEETDSLGAVKSIRTTEPRILYVYPGADSIFVTRGSEETQQTFVLKKDKE